MKQLMRSAGLLIIGVAVGWWLHDLTDQGSPHAVDRAFEPPMSPTINAPVPDAGTIPVASATPEVPEPAAALDTARFQSLLEQGAFERSINYYEDALQQGNNAQSRLKPALEDYLGARASDCEDENFVDLVNVWLEAYYADIPVLLLLAEHQRLCSSSEEAARTLQIASTYAIQPGQRESVDAAVARLMAATDEQLSRRQDWITLLGFYEFLDIIDLETQASQFRRASLYAQIGEVRRSRDLMLALRENDDGRDAALTAALNRQLAENKPAPVVEESPFFEIALARRGNHYLVPAVINDEDPLDLIIDTGASVTTLSQASFERVDGADVRYLGTRLFNTPNGITRGKLYRAASIQLGEARMSDLEIAVLEFESADGFDGLLGMNVLRNYRFEIDQDRDVLRMSPRL